MLTIQSSGWLGIESARCSSTREWVSWVRFRIFSSSLVLNTLFDRDGLLLRPCQGLRVGDVESDFPARRKWRRNQLQREERQLCRWYASEIFNLQWEVTYFRSCCRNIGGGAEAETGFPAVQALVVCVHLRIFLRTLHFARDLVSLMQTCISLSPDVLDVRISNLPGVSVGARSSSSCYADRPRLLVSVCTSLIRL